MKSCLVLPLTQHCQRYVWIYLKDEPGIPLIVTTLRFKSIWAEYGFPQKLRYLLKRENLYVLIKKNRIQEMQANLFLQYKASMECLLSTADADLQGIVYKRYLKWLYKEKDFASCVRNALKMTESHPRDVYGYEWICKIYCENHDEPHNEVWQRELTAPIQTYAEKLLQFNANSNLALLIKAFDLYAQQQYIPARQLVLQAQQSHPSYKVTLHLLARIHMHLGAPRMALLLWQELGLETEEYAQCLSHETDATKLKKAVELLQQLPQNEENVKALAR